MNILLKRVFTVVLCILLASFSVYAIPLIVNYQGKVAVEGVPFTGTGLFRFAFVDSSGAQIWSNDGNDPPEEAVNISVVNGLFNVKLGDTSLMDPLPVTVFNQDDVYLRVWFDSGPEKVSQLLTPDQLVTSVAYSFRSHHAHEAEQSVYASAADSADSADWAYDCQHAETADSADTASTADSAATATSADSATYATSAGHADSADSADDADSVGGHTYDSNWPTTAGNIQEALMHDFHNIGGIDDDIPDNDGEVPDAISINNGSLYAMTARGNVGIGTTSPDTTLHVEGAVKATGIPEYPSNAAAMAAGLTAGAFYRTGTVLKVVIDAGARFATEDITGGMMFVRGGRFNQGSPASESCRGSDETRFFHELTRDLAVMETEVTREMWDALKTAQPDLPGDPSDTSVSPSSAYPVQRVTWREAVLFANLLSLHNRFTRCYYVDAGFTTPVTASNYTTDPIYCDFRAEGYRLPTEGEWEFFCRAGSSDPFSFTETAYTSGTCHSCAGGTLPHMEGYCVFCANNPGGCEPAGSKIANAWNVKDTHGNVLEWCWDWYAAYPGDSTDYAGPGSGTDRVVRGGCWSCDPTSCRSAARDKNSPSDRDKNIGFRLVRTVR